MIKRFLRCQICWYFKYFFFFFFLVNVHYFVNMSLLILLWTSFELKQISSRYITLYLNHHILLHVLKYVLSLCWWGLGCLFYIMISSTFICKKVVIVWYNPYKIVVVSSHRSMMMMMCRNVNVLFGRWLLQISFCTHPW